jgi:hypothetical protein
MNDGFGLVELLCAITVLMVGLMAVYALFEAGMAQIKRASTVTTAAALADTQLEKLRAIKFQSIGLAEAHIASADATYTGDSAYLADLSPVTTLASAVSTTTQTTITVASASGFPTGTPYLVQIDSEILVVNAGAGTTTWTVKRGYLGTTAATHSAAANVSQKKRVSLAACGTQPCTDMVPTQTVAGADGKNYRVDTYVTWKTASNSGTPASSGRVFKLVTIVVRDSTAPYRTWARVSSAFDESTGV